VITRRDGYTERAMTYAEVEAIDDYYHRQLQVTNHPVVLVEDAVIRYKENSAIRWMMDHKSTDLNQMWIAYRRDEIDRDDFMHFYRDLGYSLAGFGEVWGDELDELTAQHSQPADE
jgi:hypothetical protein